MRIASAGRVAFDRMVALAAMMAFLATLMWLARLRLRVGRAERGERLAVERRDRFLACAAGELSAPLTTLRGEVEALAVRGAHAARAAAVVRGLDELRTLVAELAQLPRRHEGPSLVEVDLAELVREIVAEPPFSDRCPSVIVRASSATVWAQLDRLRGGLKLLLWVVRRSASPRSSLVITISADDERARVEIDAGGAEALVRALDAEPAVGYGLSASAPGETVTLALRVAGEIARQHRGRVSASSRVGEGERFVLELPR